MSFLFRAEALERDGHACVNCGAPATEVHHIVPRARGGRDVLGNLASLCDECHAQVHGDAMATFRSLQAAGRERAMAAGVKFGRKRSYSPEQAEEVRRLIAEGGSQRKVAKRTGLAATTIRRILAQQDAAA